MTIIILLVLGGYVLFSVGWMFYWSRYYDQRSKAGHHSGSGAIGVICLPLVIPIAGFSWLHDKAREIWNSKE